MGRKRLRYEWHPGFHLTGDAQAVGQELTRIERTYGRATASIIVKEAEAEESPLHIYFEWDDGLAAERYREEQARHLTRAIITVLDRGPQEPTRAFVYVSTGGDGGYVGAAKALSDVEMRAELLERARADLAAFRRKYSQLKELGVVFQAIDALSEVA